MPKDETAEAAEELEKMVQRVSSPVKEFISLRALKGSTEFSGRRIKSCRFV